MSPTVAAPVVDSRRADIPFGPGDPVACLYVQVDAASRPDIAEFLAAWRGCCRCAAVEWQTVRRPASVLVAVELAHTCGSAATLRIVFDAHRDRTALEVLVDTGTVVVGSRQYGRFANRMAAYSIDAGAVRAAISEAEQGLKRLLAS